MPLFQPIAEIGNGGSPVIEGGNGYTLYTLNPTAFGYNFNNGEGGSYVNGPSLLMRSLTTAGGWTSVDMATPLDLSTYANMNIWNKDWKWDTAINFDAIASQGLTFFGVGTVNISKKWEFEPYNFIGFKVSKQLGDSVVIEAVSNRSEFTGTETTYQSTQVPPSASSFYVFSIVNKGNEVKYYINSTLVATHSKIDGNIPDDSSTGGSTFFSYHITNVNVNENNSMRIYNQSIALL